MSKVVPYEKPVIIGLSKMIIEAEEDKIINSLGRYIKRGEGNVKVGVGSQMVSWKLLYRASQHDFKAKSFHSLCDNKGPSITLVKSTIGKLAVAYNCEQWHSNDSFSSNSKGFIASVVTSNVGVSFLKFHCVDNSYGFFGKHCWGPTFGSSPNGSDLHIADHCNANFHSDSNLGSSYQGPGASNTVLFGSRNFQVEEYEVYGINIVKGNEE